LIIHPGQLKGFNVDELEMDAARIVERTRVILEQNFGMLLSEFGTPLHGPRWRVYRPECHEWILAGTVEVDGLGALDHSPTHDKHDALSGSPHLEYDDKRLAERAAGVPVVYDSSKRLARSAVEFPLVLENMEAKLDALHLYVERLTVANERLTEAFDKIASLANPEDPQRIAEGQRKLGEYVT
jgi:hypothetical protein